MSTPVTTIGAIRDQLVTTIRALSPARHSYLPFQYAPRAIDFQRGQQLREWAESTPSACFRYYDIVQTQAEPASVSDLATQRIRTELTVTISYPRQLAMYGRDNTGELHDTQDADVRQIAAAVGYAGSANWLSALSGAAVPVTDTTEYEDGDAVRFTVFRIELEYFSAL